MEFYVKLWYIIIDICYYVYLVDEENEFVLFSSDDELIDALTQHQGDLFRVYVKGIAKFTVFYTSFGLYINQVIQSHK